MSELLETSHTTYAVVDLAALANNIRVIRELIGPDRVIIAVIKDDAYGHGMERAAECAWRSGVRHFAVATVHEALRLLDAQPQAYVLTLGETISPSEQQTAIGRGIYLTVSDAEGIDRLAGQSSKLGRPARVHLKLDTGMGRLGTREPELAATLDALRRAGQAVALCGVYTHLACSDEEMQCEFTSEQTTLFRRMLEQVKLLPTADGFLAHAANSAGILNFTETHFDAVRPGLILYGVPPAYVRDESLRQRLKPVLSLKSRIVMVKDMPAGATVSYGCTYRCAVPKRIAVVPVGYGHGYSRALSNRGMMLVGGQRVPIVGRVCMDMTMLDVTELGDRAHTGSPVTVIGAQDSAELTVSEVASCAGTIPYELLCNINSKVPRIYTICR